MRRIHARADLRGSIGEFVIQAYLYRSKTDIDQLLREGIPSSALQGRLQRACRSCVSTQVGYRAITSTATQSKVLLQSTVCHGLATHDEAMIAASGEVVCGKEWHHTGPL